MPPTIILLALEYRFEFLNDASLSVGPVSVDERNLIPLAQFLMDRKFIGPHADVAERRATQATTGNATLGLISLTDRGYSAMFSAK